MSASRFPSMKTAWGKAWHQRVLHKVLHKDLYNCTHKSCDMVAGNHQLFGSKGSENEPLRARSINCEPLAPAPLLHAAARRRRGPGPRRGSEQQLTGPPAHLVRFAD